MELDRARQVLATLKPESPAERGVLQLAQAYRSIAEGHLPDFSIAGIEQVHRRLFQGVLEKEITGHLKTRDNIITDVTGAIVKFEPTPASRAEAELKSLLAWLKTEEENQPPSVVASVFFAEFEAIHPFPDGNGRVGRFLNIALLKHLGLDHAALVPLDTRFFRTNEHYYEYLASTNSGKEYGLWCRYYVTELQKAYEATYRRGDLRKTLVRFSRPSTRSVLEWVLQGEGDWFHRGDYPNPRGYSGPALWTAFQELVKGNVLEERGEAKGREYRLCSGFLSDVYGRMA